MHSSEIGRRGDTEGGDKRESYWDQQNLHDSTSRSKHERRRYATADSMQRHRDDSGHYRKHSSHTVAFGRHEVPGRSADHRHDHKGERHRASSGHKHKKRSSSEKNLRHQTTRKQTLSTSSESSTHGPETTFIGELLRNTKAKEKIGKQESAKLLESLGKHREKLSEPEDADFKPELEKSFSDLPEHDDGSNLMPPLNSLFVSQPEKSSQSQKLNNVQIVESTKRSKEPEREAIANSTQTLVKRLGVLELPMPPVLNEMRQRKTSLKPPYNSPLTPELKPENFKHRETHYKEIRQQLAVNPVVISPLENFLDAAKFPTRPAPVRPRPSIRKVEATQEEFPDRPFSSFEIIQQIGEGTYGKVFKALDLRSKSLVAMKFVRMEHESEGFPITAIREIKILRQLRHQNVVQLREIIDHEHKNKKESGTYLVFEYMNHDLMGLLDNEKMVFNEDSIFQIFRQILEGLHFCHTSQILHRDLKCSNILVNSSGDVKLADFGLGRHFEAERPCTNKVISLWYRPIELLLGSEKYGPEVDMWSLGCIFGELFQRRAIFPFANEIDLINGIFKLCGTPTKNNWPEVKFLPGYNTLQPKFCRRVLIETFTKIIPSLALDLFDKMLCLNPEKRITSKDALASNWMQVMKEKKSIEPLKLPLERDCHEMNVKLRRKQHARNTPKPKN